MSAPIKLPEDRYMRATLLPIINDALHRARNTVLPMFAEPFVSAIIETLRTFETSQLNRERSASANSSETSRELADPAAGRYVEGTWPLGVHRAFVEGAKFWEYHNEGATMWQADRDVCEAEAIRRYGPDAHDVDPVNYVLFLEQQVLKFEARAYKAEAALSAPVSPAPEVVTSVPVDAERERLAAIFERDAGPPFVTTTLSHKDQSIVAAALRSSTPVAPNLASAVRAFVANLRADAVRFAEKADAAEFDEKFRHATKAQLTSGHADALEALLVSAPVAPVVSACEKCGGLDIGTRFFREGAENVQPSTRFDWRDCRWSNIPSGCVNQHGSLETTRDLLRRNCRTCGWWWTEPVRTSTDTPKASEAKQ